MGAVTSDALSDWDDVSFYDDSEVEEPVAPPARPTLSLVPPQEKQAEPVVEETIAREDENDGPILTVAEIKEKWELIKRRIKTRKDGSKIQAVLNGYTILQVEGTKTLPSIVLQASGKFHYEALQKDEPRKSIEWALKMELGQECQIRLLPPGQGLSVSLPPPPPRDMGGRAANSGILAPLQQSAYRERVVPPTTSVPTPQKTPKEQSGSHEPTNGVSTQTATSVPPLARMHVVRENSTSDIVSPGDDTTHLYSDAMKEEPHETRLEVLEKKAKTDPVVQEVIRMFKANMKEVQPKQQ